MIEGEDSYAQVGLCRISTDYNVNMLHFYLKLYNLCFSAESYGYWLCLCNSSIEPDQSNLFTSYLTTVTISGGVIFVCKIDN